MDEEMQINFRVTPETKEQIENLYRELNRRVSHDELLVILLKAYYQLAAGNAAVKEEQLQAPRLEKEIVFSAEAAETRPVRREAESKENLYPSWKDLRRDYTDYRTGPRPSSRPAYTKHGVFYSSVEPKINV